MISFVVIGMNEGWKLPKCIQSIIDNISFNNLTGSEIIYIDSNSSDNSIELVKIFKNLKVIKLTGDTNAAIARNVGASKAKKETLFFVDGDMEINKDTFLELFDEKLQLKKDFISGDFENYFYDNKDPKSYLGKDMHHKNKEVKKSVTTGGLFAIKKCLWNSVGGMRNEFKRSQDMDLALRLSKKNIFIYRLPINLAKHHTIDYRSKNRLWVDLWNKTHLYARSLLYRKNIFNKNIYKVIMKQDYSLVVLVLTIILSLVFREGLIMLIYLGVVILRSLPRKKIEFVVYFLIRDLKVLIGLFFFHPKKNKVSYIEV